MVFAPVGFYFAYMKKLRTITHPASLIGISCLLGLLWGCPEIRNIVLSAFIFTIYIACWSGLAFVIIPFGLLLLGSSAMSRLLIERK